MFYLGGGYFGFYFWPWVSEVLPPPDLLVDEEIHLPMYMLDTVVRPATLQGGPTLPMQIAARVTVPMGRGMSERIEIPMRCADRVILERD